jgi:hypothetical protein
MRVRWGVGEVGPWFAPISSEWGRGKTSKWRAQGMPISDSMGGIRSPYEGKAGAVSLQQVGCVSGG